MSALSRNKGSAYERRIANQLSEATGTRWRRRVRNHEGDSDVVADDPAFDCISVECKHATTLCLPAWWRQAQAQAGETRIPMLVYKRTGMIGDLVMLDAHDVNPRTFPVRGRYTVTMDWAAAMQWMREKLPAKAPYSPEVFY